VAGGAFSALKYLTLPSASSLPGKPDQAGDDGRVADLANNTIPQRLIYLKASPRFPRQPARRVIRTEEIVTMSTTTMPAPVARTQPIQMRETHAQKVSQLMPLLLAMVLLGATAVAALLISGGMH
jgi:hypothetical protein